MNRSVLLLGAVVIAAMAAYPPWDCMQGLGANRARRDSAGYAPLWAPPDRPFRESGIFAGPGCNAEISWSRLGMQLGAGVVLTLGLASAAKRS